MKLWVDDVRSAPEGYVWCHSVKDAQCVIMNAEDTMKWANNQAHTLEQADRFEIVQRIGRLVKESIIEPIDIDHDAGDYVSWSGDYIKLLDWLEETGRNYPIHIHSMNPVGVENMRRIIKRNDWKEIK